jgi:hypothetical protein
MQTYHVVLVSFGTVLIEADSVDENPDSVAFYRSGKVCAEYARPTVKSFKVADARPLVTVGH